MQPEARYREGRQDDNRLRALEPVAYGGDRLFQRRLVRLEGQRAHIGGRDRRQRIIGRNEDIGGLIVAPRLGDNALHLDCAIVRIDERGAAGRRRGQAGEIPELAIAESVMGDLAQTLVLIGRHPDDMKDQRALGFRAHDAVQRRQFADPVGGREQSSAADAGVAVGGVRGVQFIGATDPFDLSAALDRVAHREQIVSGDAEAMRDALVGNALHDVVRYAHGLHLLANRRLEQAFCHGNLPLR